MKESLSANELYIYINEKLSKELTLYSQIIFFEENGLLTFSNWLNGQGWNRELKLSAKKANKYEPVIKLLCLREIRSLLIKKQLYTLRKKQLGKLVQETLASSQSESFKIVFNENSTWSELLDQCCNMIIAEFNIEVPSKLCNDEDPESIKGWLNRWLTSPHFQKYKYFIESIDDDKEKNKAIDLAISMLKRQLHQDHVKRVYYSIIMYHQRLEEGITELRSISDPLHLSEEEYKFLTLLIKIKHTETPSILHQVIERLIVRKTRSHYVQAVAYINILRRFYDGNSSQFQEYLIILKNKFSRYSSFIKELEEHGSY
ncbi:MULTISPECIES: hypothetical protein [Bacillaceae]|uniref:Uncharacterized protein n=1 Tax=Evansella alkalicola TaxID=745819 RepID=A0ABS6JTF2_9BACI|nr:MULTISPECIES: hypothetical protein [Bacillaceae]MBU9721836.1 hypothetical protein [Bacillus alkalicola]